MTRAKARLGEEVCIVDVTRLKVLNALYGCTTDRRPILLRLLSGDYDDEAPTQEQKS
jgi:hypothetical protein